MLCHYSAAFNGKYYHLRAIENIAELEILPVDIKSKFPALGYKEIWEIKQFDSVSIYEQAEKLPSLPGVWSIWQGRNLLDVAETQDMNKEAKLFVRKLLDPPNLKYYEFRYRAHKGLKFKVVKAPVPDRTKRLAIEEAYAIKHSGKLSRWSRAPFVPKKVTRARKKA